MTTTEHKTILDIAQLTLLFGRIKRATFHEDGVLPESDTDHTIMLALACIYLAQKYYPDLDVNKINNLCLVHDLVEAYAGDTDTFMMLYFDKEKEEQIKQDKADREHAALVKIEQDFKNEFPWLIETINEYENLASKEARFVKTVDKILPKITHTLNKGTYMKLNNIDIDSWYESRVQQSKKISETFGKEFPEIIDIYRQFLTSTKEAYENSK